MINVSIRESKKLKTRTGESAFIDFPYNQKIIGYIKTLNRRSWHPVPKLWEIELEAVPAFLNFVKDYEITITGENKIYVPIFQQYSRELPKINLKSKLLKHQNEAVLYGINHAAFLLGDEAGCGKTLSTIATMLAKRKLDNYKHVLIVCGVNVLKWNWYYEVLKHTYEKPHILGMRLRTKDNKLVIKGTEEKLYDLNHLPKDSFFLITNIESLRNKDIASSIQKQIKSGEINAIIVDEAHKCCNPTAKQTQGLLSLIPDSRIALTGTPMMNKPLDLWVPLFWLGKEVHNFYQFRNYYAVRGGCEGKEIISYKHLDDLQKDLDSIMIRRLKKDCLDLPEKIFSTEYIEMESDQFNLYKEVYNSIATNIDKIILSKNPLSEMLRLRQVTSNPSILTTNTISCAKVTRLDDMLEERVQQGRKCLVVSNWTQVTDMLLDRYKKYNPATITGKIKDSDRKQQEIKLNEDPTCKILIGTIGSMGTGLTLTGASTVFFVDEPWNWTTYEQCSDRIHRIGTTDKSVEIISLLTKDTIDERIHELISEKKELSDYLVDGTLTKNKEELVKFLLS